MKRLALLALFLLTAGAATPLAVVISVYDVPITTAIVIALLIVGAISFPIHWRITR
jgi:Trk-type K+ transport system membrane component